VTQRSSKNSADVSRPMEHEDNRLAAAPQDGSPRKKKSAHFSRLFPLAIALQWKNCTFCTLRDSWSFFYT
jgi:hypothetical protein